MIAQKRSFVYNFTAQEKWTVKSNLLRRAISRSPTKNLLSTVRHQIAKLTLHITETVKFNGGPYICKPKTQETKNETFTIGNITSYGDNKGILPSQHLYLTSKENCKVLVADFFIKKATTFNTWGIHA